MGYTELPTITVEGLVIRLEVFSGVVMEARRWSETEVSSSGGGGYVINGTGHVSAARVSSNVIRHCEVFVRDECGNERSLQLTNVDLPVRHGSRVSTVLGLFDGQREGYYVGLYNHDTRVWTPFPKGIDRLAPGAPVMLPALGVVGGVSLFWVSWIPGILTCAAIGCAIVWLFTASSRGRDALRSKLNAALAPILK